MCCSFLTCWFLFVLVLQQSGIYKFLSTSEVNFFEFLYYILIILVLQIQFILDTAIRLIMPWVLASILCLRCFIENVCGFHLQLNIKLYDRKQLSGQKRCRPAQVLGEKKETVGPFSSLDGYFSVFFFFLLLTLYHKLPRRIAWAVNTVKNYHLIFKL